LLPKPPKRGLVHAPSVNALDPPSTPLPVLYRAAGYSPSRSVGFITGQGNLGHSAGRWRTIPANLHCPSNLNLGFVSYPLDQTVLSPTLPLVQHIFMEAPMSAVVEPVPEDLISRGPGTNVIITIGPSCHETPVLVEMLKCGVSCARIDLTVRSCAFLSPPTPSLQWWYLCRTHVTTPATTHACARMCTHALAPCCSGAPWPTTGSRWLT
jgi:hypothetical protein